MLKLGKGLYIEKPLSGPAVKVNRSIGILNLLLVYYSLSHSTDRESDQSVSTNCGATMIISGRERKRQPPHFLEIFDTLFQLHFIRSTYIEPCKQNPFDRHCIAHNDMIK